MQKHVGGCMGEDVFVYPPFCKNLETCGILFCYTNLTSMSQLLTLSKRCSTLNNYALWEQQWCHTYVAFFCAWITHIHKVATKIEWWIFFWVHQLPWCRLSLSRWHSTIIISVSHKQITVLGSNHPQEVVGMVYQETWAILWSISGIYSLYMDYYHWKLAILMTNYASGYTSTTKNPCMKWPKCFLCCERICLISRLALWSWKFDLFNQNCCSLF